MGTLVHDLFGLDGLGAGGGRRGVPTRGGKNEGMFRPGRRSLEHVATAHHTQKQGSAVQAAALRARVHALAKQQAPNGHAPQQGAPPMHQAPKGHPLTQPKGHGPAKRHSPFLHGIFGDGLGDPVSDGTPDQSYTPNGSVWIATQLVPLLAQVGVAGALESTTLSGAPQLVYPDGTHAMALYWLPRMDLSATFSPVIRSSFYQPSTDQLQYRESGRGSWFQTDAAAAYFGSPSWQYTIDYDCDSNSHDFLFPGLDMNQQAVEIQQGEGKLENRCKSASDWNGRDEYRTYFAANFDWSTQSPSDRAYIWLYLNLYQGPLSWTVAPADFWRADNRPIATAGAPVNLPGHAWLDSNFLSALYSDDPAVNHGMPKMINSAGQLDKAALAQWLAGNPTWATALAFPDDAMLATIYDVAAQAGYVPPAPSSGDIFHPPAPVGPDGGTPYPPDGSVPIDPGAPDGRGLPAPPAGSVPIDPSQSDPNYAPYGADPNAYDPWGDAPTVPPPDAQPFDPGAEFDQGNDPNAYGGDYSGDDVPPDAMPLDPAAYDDGSDVDYGDVPPDAMPIDFGDGDAGDVVDGGGSPEIPDDAFPLGEQLLEELLAGDRGAAWR